MSIIVKTLSVLTGAGLLLAASIAPSFASTVQISGNGAKSDNRVNFTENNRLTVSQTNNADITNDVSVASNTGSNSANDNTGGNVSISTGDSSVSVGIVNDANRNILSLGNSFAPVGNVNTTISGNGFRSDNSANVNVNNSANFSQNNEANIHNSVNVVSNTGGNSARNNTNGNTENHNSFNNFCRNFFKHHNNNNNHNNNGNVSIRTGNSNVSVSLRNLVNSNSLMF